MSLHLVIDGYNLIGASAPGPARMDLEDTRNALITRLSRYKRLKGHTITVVFDGTRSGNYYRAQMNEEGIEVIFSKDGEEADQILKELAKEERQSMTLVTSDRDVASFAEAQGSVTIPSEEFARILSTALYHDMKGVMDQEEDHGPSKRGGNPRRPSKKERKRMQKMKKL